MKPIYLTPRLAIATLHSHQDLQNLNTTIQTRHNSYYHLFNLTNIKLTQHKQSGFKWRGIPFSVTEAVKIMTQIDCFLRINIANTAIICVAHKQMEEYALVIAKCYIELCANSSAASSKDQTLNKIRYFSQNIIKTHPYFCQQIACIYETITLQRPPLKYLQSLSISPESAFIPIVQILNEGRYNDYETVYNHSIEDELSNYYLNLNRPLQTGIGKRFYDQRPETKYFKNPVLVFGDVKIVLYSFATLSKVHELTIGFNTLNLNQINIKNGGNVIQMNDADFYERQQGQPNITVRIEFADYCDRAKCKKQANCSDCKQTLKKMANRYNQVQSDLQKLHRVRSSEQIINLLSLSI